MEDLFEKLKAEPPVNPIMVTKEKDGSVTTVRRESFPTFSKPARSTISPNKCRSVSPSNVHSFEKVENGSGSGREVTDLITETPKIPTPTKAQKKLFEPIVIKPEIKVKSCKVRIKKDNLEKLREKFATESENDVPESKKKPPKALSKNSVKESPNVSKRKSLKGSVKKPSKEAKEDSSKTSSKKETEELPEKPSKKAKEELPEKRSKKATESPSKEATEESPEESSKEAKEDSPKTSSKKETEELPEKPSKKAKEELTQKPSKEATEDPSKDVTEESLEEPSKEATEDSPKTSSKKETEESPEEPSKGATEESPEEPSKEVMEESPEEPSKEATEESPEKPSKEETEESPKEPSKDQTEESPKEPTKEKTEESPKEPSKDQTEESPKERTKEKTEESPKKSPKATPTGVKRNADSDDSPPAKRGRPKSVSAKKEKSTPKTKDKSPSVSPKSSAKNKSSTGFFIKLDHSSSKKAHSSSHGSNSPINAKSPASKQSAKSPASKQSTKSPSAKPPTGKQGAKTQFPLATPRKSLSRMSVDSPTWTTKATKFTRTQLIMHFGKRFFNSVVKIKRCKHPLMLTFESKACISRQQSKNKSKNLSVSFKEQVEIIGCSDTESNYSEENPGAKKFDGNLKATTPSALLKKVQNGGKVVDDIDFEPNLFIDASNSSTPLRSKSEKKSYSPLKDDSSPSARSEQLKMANEKLPPCGLRRLGDVEDDDEGEKGESEYIVPIELPEKATTSSRSNSLNNITIDSNASTKGSEGDSVLVANNTSEMEKSEKNQTDISSSTTTNSFRSAVEELNPQSKRSGAGAAEIDKNGSSNEKESEISIIDYDKETDEVKSNGKRNGTIDTHQNANKSSSNKSIGADMDCDKLILEDDSCPATSSTPPQQNTPDEQNKTAADKMSEDIEMVDLSGDDKIENASTLIKICAEKVKAFIS